MLVTSIPQNREESKSNDQIAMDRDVLTQVQWDLMAITEHLQVVQSLVAGAVRKPGTSGGAVGSGGSDT